MNNLKDISTEDWLRVCLRDRNFVDVIVIGFATNTGTRPESVRRTERLRTAMVAAYIANDQLPEEQRKTRYEVEEEVAAKVRAMGWDVWRDQAPVRARVDPARNESNARITNPPGVIITP